MRHVVVLEELFEREAAAKHHVIKLHNPVDQKHAFKALLCLKCGCACLNLVLKLLESNCLIFAVEYEAFNETVNLAAGQASLELL